MQDKGTHTFNTHELFETAVDLQKSLYNKKLDFLGLDCPISHESPEGCRAELLSCESHFGVLKDCESEVRLDSCESLEGYEFQSCFSANLRAI